MSAVDDVFRRLKAERRMAFIPFVTAGDPDMSFTVDVLAELMTHGADLCELGVPYSDPIADGPVIQASYTRALNNKLKVSDMLAAVSAAQQRLPAPLVTMVSYAIIHRHGIERYIAQARAAGIVGAIVPDLLVDEAVRMTEACRRADFSLIHLVTPTTPRDRALRIAESSSGFVYYVSVTGITGERTTLPTDLTDSVGWLRERSPVPICIGFGISQVEHIRQLKGVADGVIVGSALVRRIATLGERTRGDVLKEMGEYGATLAAECHQ